MVIPFFVKSIFLFVSLFVSPNLCLSSSLEFLFVPFLLLDEENTTEHTPTHHMLQPPQAVFPACICAAVLPIVHLMEDGEVREDGVAGGCL